MKKAIGIDLGTSHSSAAHVEEGFPMMIEISEEGYSIPSVVSFDEKGRQSKDGVHHVRNSKRMFNRSLSNTSKSDVLNRSQQIFTYDIANSTTHNILLQIKKQTYTLEDISAEIIREVKQSVEQKINQSVDAVVLTVPAYFNELQRKSIRIAGELAGLEVLRVINEPTAAALAYGFQQDMNARIAVYDFGGGTFDLSMIDIQGSVFEVIACGGNPMLGGIDLDDCILHWIFDQVITQSGLDISLRVDLYDELRQAAERTKIDLSSKEKTTIILTKVLIPDIDQDIILELSRSKLEQMTEHLVLKSIECFDQLLTETATVKEELDKIILVGGQSKMPLVQKKLQDWFGREIDFSIHPDEAVALGGALMAEALVHQQESQQMFSLVDVLPLQIGIQREDGVIAVLFEKHTPLPTRRKYVIQTTKKKQRTLRFSLFQKNANQDQRNYDKIGDYYITGLRSLDYSKIELEFVLADDGDLSVSGRCLERNQAVKISIQGIGTYTEFQTDHALPNTEIEDIPTPKSQGTTLQSSESTPTTETVDVSTTEDIIISQPSNEKDIFDVPDILLQTNIATPPPDKINSNEESSVRSAVVNPQENSLMNPSKYETETMQPKAKNLDISNNTQESHEKEQARKIKEEPIIQPLFGPQMGDTTSQFNKDTNSDLIDNTQILQDDSNSDVDQIPLWKTNTDVPEIAKSEMEKVESAKERSITSESKSLWGPSLQNQPAETKSVSNLWSTSTTATKEENKSNNEHLRGDSDVSTREAITNVPQHTNSSDTSSQDSWLVQNSLQINQDNFFAESTEEMPSQSFLNKTDNTESQELFFQNKGSSAPPTITEKTEQSLSSISNGEEDTLQIPNYLEFGNDNISTIPKDTSTDVIDSSIPQNSSNDNSNPFAENHTSANQLQGGVQKELFNQSKDTNEHQEPIQSVFPFTPQNEIPSSYQEQEITPTKPKSQDTSSALFPSSTSGDTSSDPFAAFDDISQNNNVESHSMFDETSSQLENEDDPFASFFGTTEPETPISSEVFTPIDNSVVESQTTEEPSTKPQWTSWSAESSKPESSNADLFNNDATDQELSFPMAAMGETGDMSDNMFDSPTNNEDTFSLHSETTHDSNQISKTPAPDPFEQEPTKEQHSINEEEWLSNQSMNEQSENLGSISDELQLHRKPNAVKKALKWFNNLW